MNTTKTNVEGDGQTMEKRATNEERLGKGRMFERIRRITGYLVGTMEKWNDAKKAEEKDRVKHGLSVTTTSEFTNEDEK